MSTSANVIYYQIYKNGHFVEEHRQNILCTFRVKEELAQYQPAKDYTLICRWPDEDEANHLSYSMSLSDYMNGTKIKWED